MLGIVQVLVSCRRSPYDFLRSAIMSLIGLALFRQEAQSGPVSAKLLFSDGSLKAQAQRFGWATVALVQQTC